MKRRIIKYLKKTKDADLLNLVSGLFHHSCQTHYSQIPLVCIIQILLFWNNCVSECGFEMKQLCRKLDIHQVPHATTYVEVKNYLYKIAIKFGDFVMVNLYPSFGTFSITEADKNHEQQTHCKSDIISSFGVKKNKWMIPSEAQNKPLKIIFEIFYPTTCLTCKQEFGSDCYVKIWIFHRSLDLMGGFVTQLNISKLKCSDKIEIIC